MIEKEQFLRLIKFKLEEITFIDEISEYISNKVIEKLMNNSGIEFNTILELTFNANGIDTINWWLYEKSISPDLGIYYNGKELPSDTIEDLWELVKDNRI